MTRTKLSSSLAAWRSHHGQLPVRVRRLMTETVRAGITPVTIATSTLTEGVNLPFDVIVMPSITRTEFEGERASTVTLDPREFLNLVGRAGRPGTGVEGMTLIALATEGMSRPGSKKPAGTRPTDTRRQPSDEEAVR